MLSTLPVSERSGIYTIKQDELHHTKKTMRQKMPNCMMYTPSYFLWHSFRICPPLLCSEGSPHLGHLGHPIYY